MKKIVLCFLFFTIINSYAQEKFSSAINFVTDNDLYTSTFNDRYYTSGIFLSFKYLSKNKPNHLEKKVLEWKIGQEMFTPFTAVVRTVKEHDRPFAAYLFGSYSIDKIYKNKQSFKTEFQFGMLGPNAYGKELQDLIHNIYGFKKAVGWKHQIKNAIGFNFNVTYQKLLSKENFNHFDITWISSGKIGSIYTDISTGFLTRIGLKPLQIFANTIAFNSNLNDKNTNNVSASESFFYMKPFLRYAFYDATLEGSFLNSGSNVTNVLNPLVFNLEIGYTFTLNRFYFGYVYHYNTNKSKGLNYNKGQIYGRIAIGYLLR